MDSSGPRSAALGGAGVALDGDSWSPLRNPALVIEAADGAGMSWSQQFGLPELNREVICAKSKLGPIPLAIRGINFGSALYREGEFGLILAYLVEDYVSLGIEAGGKWLEIRDYSSGSAFSFSAGLAVQPTNRIRIGIVWTNLNSPRMSGFSDRIRESLKIGMAARIANDAILAADIIQEEHFRAEYRWGLEARLLSNFRLRVGARAEPIRPSAGFQLDIGRWGFNYGGDLHPDLGPSHEVGLEVKLGR